MDTAAFNSCVDSGKHRQIVQQDMALGQQLGVTGTPAFFINGRFLNGAQPYAKFKDIIDEELARAGTKTASN